MAIDIANCISGVEIKHGITVVNIPNSGGSVTGTPYYQTLETDVTNTPVIADIQEKYTDRFDDRSYYVT